MGDQDRTAIIIGGIPVEVINGEVRYEAGAAVDADGAPTAYALPSSGLIGLDNIRNALVDTDDDPEHPAHGWAGVIVGPDGRPIIQKDGPGKGHCLSPTALQDHNFPVDDYRRYVDSSTIPYISIPPQLERLGVRLGDAALVACRKTALSIQCVVADIGPRKRLGEVSIAAAKGLGFNANPRNGGIDHGVIVRIFVGSAKVPAWDSRRTAADVAAFVDAFASRT